MVFCPECGTRLEESVGDRLVCPRCGYEVEALAGPLGPPPEAIKGTEDRTKLAWHLIVSLAFIGGVSWLVFGVAGTAPTLANILIFVGAIVGYGVVGAVVGPRDSLPADTKLNPIGCLLGGVLDELILRLALYPGRAIAGVVGGLVRLISRRR
jgi:hypothetical protein